MNSVTNQVTIVIIMVTTSIIGPEASILFSKTRRAVLSLLFMHVDESFYLREIVRLTGAGIGPVQRELKKLTGAGILRRSKSGHQVYYCVNRENPIFPELKSLIIKTAGLADVIRFSLEPLADRIEIAFIYGSFASGKETQSSDVDVMVVGRAGLQDVVSALLPAQDTLRREINPSICTVGEFKKGLKTGRHFIYRIWKEKKIILIGDNDVIRGYGT